MPTESGMDLDYCTSNSCPFQAEACRWKYGRLASGLGNNDLCLKLNKGIFGNFENKHGGNNLQRNFTTGKYSDL